eukprot:1474326-Lingulodinium_polyedra.AAC.1
MHIVALGKVLRSSLRAHDDGVLLAHCCSVEPLRWARSYDLAHARGDRQARQMAECALRAGKKRRAFAQSVGVGPIWVDPVVVDVVQ